MNNLKRAIASQMSDKVKLERTNIKISCNQHDDLFIANGEVILLMDF